MIGFAVAAALCVASLVFLACLARGPSQLDRLAAVQGVFLCAALLAATLGARDSRWIDAALVLTLAGAVIVVAGVRTARGAALRTSLDESDAA